MSVVDRWVIGWMDGMRWTGLLDRWIKRLGGSVDGWRVDEGMLG